MPNPASLPFWFKRMRMNELHAYPTSTTVPREEPSSRSAEWAMSGYVKVVLCWNASPILAKVAIVKFCSNLLPCAPTIFLMFMLIPTTTAVSLLCLTLMRRVDLLVKLLSCSTLMRIRVFTRDLVSSMLSHSCH